MIHQIKISMAFEKVLLNGGLLSIAVIVLCTAIKNDFANNRYQPNYIKPLYYDIKIRLYVKRNIFIGEYNSTIRIDRKTSNITMQLFTFGIHKIFLIDKNERIYIPKDMVYENHTIDFNFKKSQYKNFELLPDTYILKMTYIRMMFDQENFNKYYVGANAEQIMATKGIEIIQQLFPWPTTFPRELDKQTFKASFNISVMHHQNYTVLSNMPVLTKYEDKNYMMWTCFEQLPYTFAEHLTTVVTTFSNIATSLPNIKFWCRQNMTELVQIAKTNVENVAQYLIENNLMKVPKMDYVVIKDSDHNDDEMWGLILQSDTHIMYNETFDSAMRKIQIAHYIARQMASLWYVDAILWSKNSFTMFFGAYILDQIQQNDNTIGLIVVQTQEFLRFLTPSYVNPLLSINTHIRSEDKLFSSSLHHMKSFAIWRLLYLISDDMFWIAMRKYIDTYNDSDTTNVYDNLWTIMQNTINSRNSEYKLNINDIIDMWIMKTYYPVLNVTRDYKNNAVEIVCIKSIDIIDNDTKNWIPVTYTTKSSLNFTKANNLFWLNLYNQSYRIEGIDRNDWILVNIQQIGYYRVNYDLENWNKLAYHLNYKYTKIHVLNRAQIIDDAYHFLLHKQISYKMFWTLTNFLTQDTDYIAWYPMIKAFEHIMCIFPIGYGKDVRKNVIRMLKALVTNIGYYKKLGDNDFTECLREEMIKWACILDISDCRQIANKKLKKELNFEQNTDLSLKEWIYCKGSMVADDETLHSLWSLWPKTLDIRILEFMACSENPIFIYNYLLRNDVTNAIPFYDTKELEKLETEFKANKQAYIFLFIVAKHAKNDLIFMILRNLNHFKPKVDTIATLIVIITHINSANHLEEVMETFVESHQPQKNLFQAIRQKVKKRKLEYLRLIENYKFLV